MTGRDFAHGAILSNRGMLILDAFVLGISPQRSSGGAVSISNDIERPNKSFLTPNATSQSLHVASENRHLLGPCDKIHSALVPPLRLSLGWVGSFGPKEDGQGKS